ncbi:MAG: SlyX family protein [Thermoanaerobaculia bacterium]|nr:SlyX family protein [Thermoanaerobaculia bacterium]
MFELESANAYLTKRVADLDDVVLEFTRRVERLERQLLLLSQRLEELGESSEPDDAPPPHY